MGIIKLRPVFKDYIWGGSRLKERFGKDFKGDVLAESWELSAHPDGPSTVAEGQYAGSLFPEYIEKKGKGVLGRNGSRFQDFPVLIKFIDARQNLSVQVHPDDEFALKHEHQYGKTECWYVVDAGPEAGIFLGLKEKLSKERFEEKIRDNTLLETLNFVPVKPGEMYFIKAGTLHAIAAGTLIAEIQQNSNVTYRVYDFGRVGQDGKPRPLHIKKAVEVSDLSGVMPHYDFGEHLAKCDLFTVDGMEINGEAFTEADGDSFVSVLFVEGSGDITVGDESFGFRAGDSFFVDAGSGTIKIKGSGKALITRI